MELDNSYPTAHTGTVCYLVALSSRIKDLENFDKLKDTVLGFHREAAKKLATRLTALEAAPAEYDPVLASTLNAILARLTALEAASKQDAADVKLAEAVGLLRRSIAATSLAEYDVFYSEVKAFLADYDGEGATEGGDG